MPRDSVRHLSLLYRFIYLPSTTSKNEPPLVAVGHSKAAVPLPANRCWLGRRYECQLWVDSGCSRCQPATAHWIAFGGRRAGRTAPDKPDYHALIRTGGPRL
jgi:hypothetical protein